MMSQWHTDYRAIREAFPFRGISCRCTVDTAKHTNKNDSSGWTNVLDTWMDLHTTVVYLMNHLAVKLIFHQSQSLKCHKHTSGDVIKYVSTHIMFIQVSYKTADIVREIDSNRGKIHISTIHIFTHGVFYFFYL